LNNYGWFDPVGQTRSERSAPPEPAEEWVVAASWWGHSRLLLDEHLAEGSWREQWHRLENRRRRWRCQPWGDLERERRRE
jgi:hypothetical protein